MRPSYPLAACALALACATPPLHAQAFASKTMRIIVPFAAGGAVDQLARILAKNLSEDAAWGQPVLVENRPGGGAMIGTDHVAKSAPDGHTIGLVAASYVIQPILQSKMPFDIFRDLQPVTLATWQPHVLVVHPSVPAQSVQELISYARANPGKLGFASVGPGSGQHLSGETFKSMAGVDIVHVPFQGSAPAVNAMLGGHVGMMIGALPDVQPHIRSSKMRVLAVASLDRVVSLPDVPTVNESGLKGFESIAWFGFVAPSAVPRPVIGQIQSGLVRQMQKPDVREQLVVLGMNVRGSTPEEYGAVLKADYAKFARIAKIANVKID